MNSFELFASCSKARAGWLTTSHGKVATPVFMPVGTQATVKALVPEQVKDIGYNMILCNTYHLMLQPGVDIIKQAGGLHKFMNWDRLILTDSGGFQVMSQSGLREIRNEGVEFKSFLDGSKHFLTPEAAIEIQEHFGSDIAMVLDICTPYPISQQKAKYYAEITHSWAKRSINAKKNDRQLVFGIIQGGFELTDRAWSTDVISSFPFDGIAIGSLSVGEPKELTGEILEAITPKLPRNKPRYLMGVGDPVGIIQGIENGIDMFDSVLPTRLGRNATIMVKSGTLSMMRSKWADDFSPIDDDCHCYTCENYSKAYVRHLFKAHEILAATLATIHNLHFLKTVVDNARKAIIEGKFYQFKRSWDCWRENDNATESQ